MSTVRELIDQIVSRNKDEGGVHNGITTTLATMIDALKIAQNALINTGDITLFQDLVAELDSSMPDIADSIVANTQVADEAKSDAVIQPLKTDTPLESNASAGSRDAAQML